VSEYVPNHILEKCVLFTYSVQIKSYIYKRRHTANLQVLLTIQLRSVNNFVYIGIYTVYGMHILINETTSNHWKSHTLRNYSSNVMSNPPKGFFDTLAKPTANKDLEVISCCHMPW
jgi:hypothetical protein